MSFLRRPFLWLVLAVLLLVAGLWFFWPRRASLRSFDPATMGRLEADMWHCYYDKRYFGLAWDLWQTARGQYGFSPLDSLRLARHAALAAKAAQPVQTRDQAYAHALPDLIDYYRIICRSTGTEDQAEDLADAELNWWVLRREGVGVKRYGEAVAAATALLYDLPENVVHDSAMLRAEMMDYRDQRREGLMTAEDWRYIAQRLGDSYTLLLQAVK